MLKQRKRDDDDAAKHSGRLHDGSGNRQLIHHMAGFIVSDGVTAVPLSFNGFNQAFDALLKE